MDASATPPGRVEHRVERDVELLERQHLDGGGPDQFRVVLLNDDYTPMDFVVIVLETIFRKSPTEAYGIMMRVHKDGRGVAGVFPHEIAETKAARVEEEAQVNGYPLRAAVEPESPGPRA